MATKYITIKQKIDSGGTLDNLIPNNSLNTTNAVVNSNGTYSSLTNNSTTDVLTLGTETISKKILVAEPDVTLDGTNDTYDITSLGFVDGDKIELEIDWRITGTAYIKNKIINARIPFEDTLPYFSYITSSGHGVGAITSFCGISIYDTGTQTIIFNQSTGARKITTFSGESPTVEVVTQYFKIKKIWKIIE